MQFFTITAAALCLAAPTFAAPTRTSNSAMNLVPRNATKDASTTTLSTATSTATISSATQTLYPNLQVRFSSKTPTVVAKHNAAGHLLNNDWEQVTTAVHFDMPDSAEGKMCRLVFRMTVDDTIVGNADLDVYKLAGCLNDDYTYEHRARGDLARELAVGHLTAVKGKKSEWLPVAITGEVWDPIMGSAPEFPCKAKSEYSFELVKRGAGNIGWTSPRGGLSIEIYN